MLEPPVHPGWKSAWRRAPQLPKASKDADKCFMCGKLPPEDFLTMEGKIFCRSKQGSRPSCFTTAILSVLAPMVEDLTLEKAMLVVGLAASLASGLREESV